MDRKQNPNRQGSRDGKRLHPEEQRWKIPSLLKTRQAQKMEKQTKRVGSLTAIQLCTWPFLAVVDSPIWFSWNSTETNYQQNPQWFKTTLKPRYGNGTNVLHLLLWNWERNIPTETPNPKDLMWQLI